MDPMIGHYVQQFKNVGHRFGHDPRSHGYQNVRWHLAGEQPNEGIERQEQPNGQAQAQRPQDQAAHDYLVRHEELLTFGDDEEEADSAAAEPWRVKRSRVPPDTHRQHNNVETRAKRARISIDERRVPDREPVHENAEGFGDHERESYGNQKYVFLPHHSTGR